MAFSYKLRTKKDGTLNVFLPNLDDTTSRFISFYFFKEDLIPSYISGAGAGGDVPVERRRRKIFRRVRNASRRIFRRRPVQIAIDRRHWTCYDTADVTKLVDVLSDVDVVIYTPTEEEKDKETLTELTDLLEASQKAGVSQFVVLTDLLRYSFFAYEAKEMLENSSSLDFLTTIVRSSCWSDPGVYFDYGDKFFDWVFYTTAEEPFWLTQGADPKTYLPSAYDARKILDEVLYRDPTVPFHLALIPRPYEYEWDAFVEEFLPFIKARVRFRWCDLTPGDWALLISLFIAATLTPVEWAMLISLVIWASILGEIKRPFR